ncbi:UvrD-helicase domain-containing protein [Thiohalorhabdus sp. Cl-TMA]|uniref:DNA 3'-5' helicase n=1 Tax=Thiohalorhabdus methylotrophus TaxID=3242694 RepID=A0ABV4TQ02_9GAMM
MTLVRPEDWYPQGVDELEPKAWEALKAAGSVLVTAGAGSGKTEFLAQKATYFLQTALCPSPKRILAISFKRDAARNLASRIEKRCPPDQARRFDSYTFDAFAKGLLDRFRAAIPDPYRPSGEYRIIFPGRTEFEDFLQRREIRSVNTKQLESAIIRTRLPIRRNGRLGRIVQSYWQEQLEENEEALLSFPMINRLIDYLLRENSTIKRALQLTYPVVFIDEFQDTTDTQFQLIREAFEGSGAALTAVGDDKQQIMAWAGAMHDGFERFQDAFTATHFSLVSNWRSHPELVRIQQAIASRIDPTIEEIEARGTKTVAGHIAAIWDFSNREEEAATIGAWVSQEIFSGEVKPHNIALLVRMKPNEVEEEIRPELARHGLRLRNEARAVGDIPIQDLLGEDLTEIFLPLLRLGASERDASSWNTALRNFQYLEAADPQNDFKQQAIQQNLESFVRVLRGIMRRNPPTREIADELACQLLEKVDEDKLRQAFPFYRRQRDFDRVWGGFRQLLTKCAEQSPTWSQAIDEFVGYGQIPLMTIHKSKGLEFHTMIFLGLDNQSWWSLSPDKPQELNAFFVAFTRAEQRAFFSLSREHGRPVTWLENLLEPAGMERIHGGSLTES